MAKSKKEPTVLEEAPKEGNRAARWKIFLETARAQNPVKFEIKEENGEFDTIPDSFN